LGSLYEAYLYKEQQDAAHTPAFRRSIAHAPCFVWLFSFTSS
jgi:hypothetical protein